MPNEGQLVEVIGCGRTMLGGDPQLPFEAANVRSTRDESSSRGIGGSPSVSRLRLLAA